MLADDLLEQSDWIEYSGQMDSDVTYFFRSSRPIPRLRGESDILYIGKTEQAIRVRYEQETHTNNSPRNTQQTNIRTTHAYRQLGLDSPQCYYTKHLKITLLGNEVESFMQKIAIWDKRFYLSLLEEKTTNELPILLEKMLLVNYADEHLEVPPLNNRV